MRNSCPDNHFCHRRALVVTVALFAVGLSATSCNATTDRRPTKAPPVPAPAPAVRTINSPHPHHNVCRRSATEVPACGVLWGLYTPIRSKQSQPTAPYPKIERQIGRRFDIVERYEDWVPGVTFPTNLDRKLAAGGHRILDFSWHAIDYRTRKQISWASIARGKWDASVILPEARQLEHWHHKVFISFDSEFDNTRQRDRGTPKQYAMAYRHIYDVFSRAHVHNVIWAWVPTGYLPNETFIEHAYPGNRYVDWVGYDPYNFYSCHDSTDWRSPYDTFSGFYQWLQQDASTRGKPILLGEYGTAPGPHEKQWYAEVAPTLHRLPLIKGLIQWSSGTSATCNFAVTRSRRTMAGFVTSGLSPYVLGR